MLVLEELLKLKILFLVEFIELLFSFSEESVILFEEIFRLFSELHSND